MLVIAAGGTGGHIMPALALAKAWDGNVAWFGQPNSLEMKIAKKHNILFCAVESTPLGLGKKMPKQSYQLLKAITKSRKLLKQLQPDYVFSTGSFASFPTAMAAKTLSIPLIIHEQNTTMGLANRVLMRFANRVCLGMPISSLPKNWVVGNPLLIQPTISQGQKILIFAGSQGSQFLNQHIPKILSDLNIKMPILHIAGKEADVVQSAYDKLGLEATVYDFVYDMDSIYKDTKIVICRAGAMTLAEITAYAIPAILVPYPYASDDHQRKNALFLENKGAAFIVGEQAESLKAALLKIQQAKIQRNMKKSLIDLQSNNAVEKIISRMINIHAQKLSN